MVKTITRSIIIAIKFIYHLTKRLIYLVKYLSQCTFRTSHINSITFRCHYRSWKWRMGDVLGETRVAPNYNRNGDDRRRYSALAELNRRIAGVQTSFLFSAWHNRVLGDTWECVRGGFASARACGATAGRPGVLNRPACVKVRAFQLGFRTRRFSTPRSSKLKLDFVTWVIILKSFFSYWRHSFLCTWIDTPQSGGWNLRIDLKLQCNCMNEYRCLYPRYYGMHSVRTYEDVSALFRHSVFLSFIGQRNKDRMTKKRANNFISADCTF